jgi:signal transduction histidine kinase
MIDDTHAASIRLIEIVSDFLDSSKLEQGKMVFNPAPIPVKPIIDNVAKDLEPILQAHTNTVHLEGMDAVPTIMADEGRYRQIMYNLLSNATKYSEHCAITVTADYDDEQVTIHVTDTGKGISPENQKLLFHKFQQASDTLTRDDTKGTGLGLYISRLLATNMHGDVVLEHTEVGKGSTFSLRLPRAKEHTEPR